MLQELQLSCRRRKIRNMTEKGRPALEQDSPLGKALLEYHGVAIKVFDAMPYNLYGELQEKGLAPVVGYGMSFGDHVSNRVGYFDPNTKCSIPAKLKFLPSEDGASAEIVFDSGNPSESPIVFKNVKSVREKVNCISIYYNETKVALIALKEKNGNKEVVVSAGKSK